MTLKVIIVTLKVIIVTEVVTHEVNIVTEVVTLKVIIVTEVVTHEVNIVTEVVIEVVTHEVNIVTKVVTHSCEVCDASPHCQTHKAQSEATHSLLNLLSTALTKHLVKNRMCIHNLKPEVSMVDECVRMSHLQHL